MINNVKAKVEYRIEMPLKIPNILKICDLMKHLYEKTTNSANKCRDYTER